MLIDRPGAVAEPGPRLDERGAHRGLEAVEERIPVRSCPGHPRHRGCECRRHIVEALGALLDPLSHVEELVGVRPQEFAHAAPVVAARDAPGFVVDRP